MAERFGVLHTGAESLRLEGDQLFRRRADAAVGHVEPDGCVWIDGQAVGFIGLVDQPDDGSFGLWRVRAGED